MLEYCLEVCDKELENAMTNGSHGMRCTMWQCNKIDGPSRMEMMGANSAINTFEMKYC